MFFQSDEPVASKTFDERNNIEDNNQDTQGVSNKPPLKMYNVNDNFKVERDRVQKLQRMYGVNNSLY